MSGAGATQYTFHVEATSSPGDLIRKIKEAGMRVSNHNIVYFIVLPVQFYIIEARTVLRSSWVS